MFFFAEVVKRVCYCVVLLTLFFLLKHIIVICLLHSVLELSSIIKTFPTKSSLIFMSLETSSSCSFVCFFKILKMKKQERKRMERKKKINFFHENKKKQLLMHLCSNFFWKNIFLFIFLLCIQCAWFYKKGQN